MSPYFKQFPLEGDVMQFSPSGLTSAISQSPEPIPGILKRHWCAWQTSGRARAKGVSVSIFCDPLIRLDSPDCSSKSVPLQLCCLSRTTASIPRTILLRARQVVILPPRLQSLTDMNVFSISHPSQRAYRLLISSRGRSSRHYHMDLVHLLFRLRMSNSAHTLPQSTPHVILPRAELICPLTQNHRRWCTIASHGPSNTGTALDRATALTQVPLMTL